MFMTYRGLFYIFEKINLLKGGVKVFNTWTWTFVELNQSRNITSKAGIREIYQILNRFGDKLKEALVWKDLGFNKFMHHK